MVNSAEYPLNKHSSTHYYYYYYCYCIIVVVLDPHIDPHCPFIRCLHYHSSINHQIITVDICLSEDEAPATATIQMAVMTEATMEGATVESFCTNPD